MSSYQKLIDDLVKIDILSNSEQENINQVKAVVSPWLSRTDWLEDRFFNADKEIGFTAYNLHTNNDGSLLVNLLAWYPGVEVVPHNHGTWAVVGCVKGREKNCSWKRLDDGNQDGFAKIERSDDVIYEAGECIGLESGIIHSVVNLDDELTLSLHVYGKDLNLTDRVQFDVVNNKTEPFPVNYE